MQSKLDIAIIIVFVITLSILFGLSIVNVIDKKISNVSVNIPPIKVPKQNLTIKLKCDESTRIDPHSITQIEKTIIEEPIKENSKEEFRNIRKVEHYDSVSIDTIDNINNDLIKNNDIPFKDKVKNKKYRTSKYNNYV